MKLYADSQEPPKPQADSAPRTPEPKPLSYRLKNWWYYHKWYVICGAALLFALGDILWHILGIGQKKPDFQIAYVGSVPLSDAQAAALENAFTELGGDFNGDGTTIVTLNQYVTADDETMGPYGFTGQVQLMGDLSACESYFFLTDDPEGLQREYQLFADADGSSPAEGDTSVPDKVTALADCPALAEKLQADTGEAEGTDGASESELTYLSTLYLGRRYFYKDKTVDFYEQCCELWDTITG